MAWAQVSIFTDPLFVIIDTPTTTAALSRLQADKLDGDDLFILESILNQGVFQIITCDGSFATVPIIQVFTINRKVIQAARDADWLCDDEFVYDFFGKMERKGHWK